MKNDDEMYRSVLSRRNIYRERKKKRTRTIKRITPVLACFFLTIVLGLGYRDSFSKLLKVSTQPNIIEEPPIVVTDTTEPANESPESTKPSATESKSTDNSAAVSTMVIVSGTETMQTASAHQHQSQTVTTAPVADMKPITEVQTTAPIQTASETTKTIVNKPDPIIAETTKHSGTVQEPADSPSPSITTKVTDIVQDPVYPPVQEPVAPPAQPIFFDDITDVVDSIKNYGQNGGYDGSGAPLYYEECLMFERFKNDGFIYQVNSNDSITLRDDLGIFLFPYAAYEDIGIGYYVTYKGKLYHVMFYYADRDLINETDGITQYLQKRTGRSSDKEIVIQDQTVSVLFSDDGQTYAGSFVDQNNYYDIVTSATEDELMNFLSIFSYEKIPL